MTNGLTGFVSWLSSVDVNTYGYEEDGYKSKEDYGVDENGYPTGLHVSKLHDSAPPRQLKQQPWT